MIDYLLFIRIPYEEIVLKIKNSDSQKFFMNTVVNLKKRVYFLENSCLNII